MGSKSQTQTTQQSTTPFDQAGMQAIFKKVQDAASTPFNPYSGELVAGINGQQQLGINNINNAAGWASPYFGAAGGLAAGAANPLTQQQIESYLNPYTKNVIDATRANFTEQNDQEQNKLKGNAASVGALGGDRQAVAQAETARQQHLAQDPVIAGLQQQGYTQALQTAAQQYQQNPLAVASSLAGIGAGGQSAALQGAHAQLGAGTLQQGTQQAADQAAYQQYLQKQGYPFQAAEFFAKYGLPASVAQGSSAYGTQTTPGPNPWSQIAGLGIAGAGLFLKDGGVVPHMADGGSPFSFVDQGGYAKSFIPTDGSMPSVQAQTPQLQFAKPDTSDPLAPVTKALGSMKGKFAGADYLTPGSSIPGAVGPTSVGGPNGPSPLYPDDWPGSSSNPLPGMTADDYGEGFKSGGFVDAIHQIHHSIKRARGGVVGAGNPFAGYADGGATRGTGSFLDEDPGVGERVARFVSGGRDFGQRALYNATRAGLYNSGTATEEGHPYGGLGLSLKQRRHLDMGDAQRIADKVRGYADGGNIEDMWRPATMDERFAPVVNAIESGTFDPQGINATEFKPPHGMAAANRGDIPLPVARSATKAPILAAAANEEDDGAIPEAATPTSSPSPLSLAPQAPDATQAPQPAPEHRFGHSLFGANLSDKTRQSLVAAGLGMLASKSPFFGTALGEGGLKGLGSYSDLTKQEQEAANQAATKAQNQQRISMEAQRIAQSAEQFSKTNSLSERKFKAEQERTKYIPAGSILGEDGTLRPAVMEQSTGRIIDAVSGEPVKATDKVVTKGTRAPVSEEDAKALADYYVKTGDASRLNGLGITGEARQKVQHYVNLAQKEQNVTNEELATRKVEFEGRKAGQRTLGTMEAKMGSAAMEAEGAINQARGVIERLPRTSFLPFNQLIQNYQNKTLNPDQAELYGRTQAIVNTYAAVMARGANVTTDSSRAHAEGLLNTAGNAETYNRMLDTLLSEINMAKHSPEKMREFYRQQFGPKSLAPEGGSAPAASSPAAPAVPPPPPGIPPGSEWSPSLKKWSPDKGKTLYNADGSKA